MAPEPPAHSPRFVRAPGVLWRNTMRGVLVSIPDEDEPVLCTSPGDDVWALLDTPRTMGELARELATRYDAEESVIAGDLQPVLERLLAVGAIREAET